MLLKNHLNYKMTMEEKCLSVDSGLSKQRLNAPQRKDRYKQNDLILGKIDRGCDSVVKNKAAPKVITVPVVDTFFKTSVPTNDYCLNQIVQEGRGSAQKMLLQKKQENLEPSLIDLKKNFVKIVASSKLKLIPKKWQGEIS